MRENKGLVELINCKYHEHKTYLQRIKKEDANLLELDYIDIYDIDPMREINAGPTEISSDQKEEISDVIRRTRQTIMYGLDKIRKPQ